MTLTTTAAPVTANTIYELIGDGILKGLPALRIDVLPALEMASVLVPDPAALDRWGIELHADPDQHPGQLSVEVGAWSIGVHDVSHREAGWA
jgi:hypothetical protein